MAIIFYIFQGSLLDVLALKFDQPVCHIYINPPDNPPLGFYSILMFSDYKVVLLRRVAFGITNFSTFAQDKLAGYSD
jgi:hypothetical protein